MQYLISAGFALLAVGFWVFQVAQHEKFSTMAENNHIRRLPLPAPRGVLFDRNGDVLVDNQSMFNIALVREQTGNLENTLRVLSEATGVPEAQLRETVERRRLEPKYRPMVLIENASLEQVIAARARQWELPGVFSQEVPTRKYLINDSVLAKPHVASRVLHQFRELASTEDEQTSALFAPLTSREIEILDCIARGLSNKEIANELSISGQTVKNHITSILSKLQVNDRTMAVIYAIQKGWIRMGYSGSPPADDVAGEP